MRRVSADMAQQIRALVTLTKDLGLTPGTHVVAQTIFNFRSMKFESLYWPLQGLHRCGGHAGMRAELQLKTIF